MSNLIQLSEENFHGVEALDSQDLLDPFTCLLCYGVAIDPRKCEQCETVYCKECLPESAFNPNIRVRYPDKPYQCFKMCGSKKIVNLSRLERNILNNLKFRCQHEDEFGCTEVLTYETYKQHLAKECVEKVAFPVELPSLSPVRKVQIEMKKDGPTSRGKVVVESQQEEVQAVLNCDAIQLANLPNLFQEEDEEIEDQAWRFEKRPLKNCEINMALSIPPWMRDAFEDGFGFEFRKEEEYEEHDLFDLFGDDDY